LIWVARLADERYRAVFADGIECRVLSGRGAGAVDRDIRSAPARRFTNRFHHIVLTGVDENVGAKFSGKFEPRGEEIRRDGVRARSFRDQQGSRAHRTQSDEGHIHTAAHTQYFLRVVLTADHVRHERARNKGDFVWQRQAVAFGNHEIIRVAAVDVEAQTLPARTQHRVAAQTVFRGVRSRSLSEL
jgi:hypothetical protein